MSHASSETKSNPSKYN